MLSNESTWFYVTAGFIVILVAVVFVQYFRAYSEGTRYVKSKMKRAFDEEEYLYWKQRLRIMRWCVIPGVTPERIERRLERKNTKTEKKVYVAQSRKSDDLLLRLWPSLLGIAMCALFLAGTSCVWYMWV
ncbi:MAG: hypothetical protein UHS49_03240 [Faecalimonas sp.]|nr:hypothetical protein [Faecalimonas sp.]